MQCYDITHCIIGQFTDMLSKLLCNENTFRCASWDGVFESLLREVIVLQYYVFTFYFIWTSIES